MRLARRSALARLLPRYEAADVTYAEIGATQGTLPDGYHHVRRRTRLGDGDAVFDRAEQAMMTWRMHRAAGLAVAGTAPASVGQTVLCGFGWLVSVVIPCRVVYVVHEPDRRGFGYGTLPGHPESGEESFVITRDSSGLVWFDITAFSRPGSRLNAATAPVDRWFQSYVTSRYERALRTLSA